MCQRFLHNLFHAANLCGHRSKNAACLILYFNPYCKKLPFYVWFLINQYCKCNTNICIFFMPFYYTLLAAENSTVCINHGRIVYVKTCSNKDNGEQKNTQNIQLFYDGGVGGWASLEKKKMFLKWLRTLILAAGTVPVLMFVLMHQKQK